MKKLYLATMVASALYVSSVQAAAAAEKYYLDLGKAVSEEKAVADWQALQKTHKNLGKLDLFPIALVEPNGKIMTRVQAGPIADKKVAQSLCVQLFKKNTPCFVVEGAGDLTQTPAPTQVAAQTQDVALLPWQTANAPIVLGQMTDTETPVVQVMQSEEFEPKPVSSEPPAETDADEPSFFSWFSDDEEPEVKIVPPAPAAVAAPVVLQPAETQGNVNVAEAIPVPLTRSEPVHIVAPAPQVVAVPAAPRVEMKQPAAPAAKRVPGWLRVAAFTSEGVANETWQTIRLSAPHQSAGLNARVSVPVIKRSRESDDASLQIGPFTDKAEAMAFCSNIVLKVSNELRCGFNVQESGPGTQQARPAKYQHTKKYAMRRQLLERRRPAVAR